MITEPTGVIQKLRECVSRGYDPQYSYESACDHDADWLALPIEEFMEIKLKARQERALRLAEQGFNHLQKQRPAKLPAERADHYNIEWSVLSTEQLGEIGRKAAHELAQRFAEQQERTASKRTPADEMLVAG